MTEESQENFNNLDNFELKNGTSCCTKKVCIIVLSLIILTAVIAGGLIVYFFILNKKCEIGEEEKCLTCDKKDCASCNPGYKLSNGKCIIDYSIKAEYYIEAVREIQLIYDSFLNQINELIIDGEIIEPCTKYNFNSTGIHKVYFKMDISNINSLYN